MSEVVEGILVRHSLLKGPRQPVLIDGIPRPRYYWQKLSRSVRETIEAVSRSDDEDRIVRHGIHFRRDIAHDEAIIHGLYNKVTDQYLTLDTNYIHVYEKNGHRLDTVIPASIIERLNHANLVNLYVGWRPGKQELYLMTTNFDIISESAAGYDIISVVYNENNGEFVTSGAGVLSMWAFRYGARHLIPRATTTYNLTADDQFSLLVLENTPQPSQKLFAVCDTSIAVFHVGDCVLTNRYHDLHSRPITAAAFFNPLKQLITGSKDGCIKVWNDSFALLHVFVGHNGRVNTVAIYPHGACFISVGEDNTMRVWNLDVKDQVDIKKTDEPIYGMGTVIGFDHFYTYSGTVMKLWKLNHLHCQHTNIGHAVNDIKHTTHPMFPVRSVLRCNDASVRLVCPKTGDVITSVLMPMQRSLVDCVYASELNAVFSVFANGDLVKASAITNPCRVVAEWKCDGIVYSTLLIYEYIVNMWGVETKPGKHKNKTLLLAGREDGFISVVNMKTGETDFEIEAHSRKGVRKMVSNVKFDQLISAGADNIIKIWRVYPYAQEALAPLMSFFCAHLPVHMVMLKRRLCVAFEDHGTATYNVIIHDLETKERFDHEPICDHTDSITGLSCCQRLKIFASSSYDGTVKIWNEINELIRVLVLNATPISMGFCSQRGDLVLGLGNHLHYVAYNKFLPKKLLFRMVCMRFPTVKAESPITFDEELLKNLRKTDIRRLKAAKAAFTFDSFSDVLGEDEEDKVLGETREKEKAFSVLNAREQELVMIRDGILQSKPRMKPTKHTKNEAFDKYLKIFYDRPKVDIPEETKSIDQQMKEMQDGPTKPFREKYIPEIATGFFPNPNQASKQKPESELLPPGCPPDGFVPNSVLIRLLWPEKEKLQTKTTNLSDDLLARLAKLNKNLVKAKEMEQQENEFKDRSLILDYSDDEEEMKEQFVDMYDDEVKLPPLDNVETKNESKEASSFLLQLQGVMAKPPTPEPEPITEPEAETTSSSLKVRSEPTIVSRNASEVTVASTKTEPATPSKTQIKPLKPVKKLVSKGPPPQPRLPTPPAKIPAKVVEKKERDLYSPAVAKDLRAQKDEEPEEIVETLPDFILRCKGQKWFEKYFPNCNENTFPKPWTVDAFVTMLLRVLRVAEYEYKCGVCNTLGTIQTQEGLPNTIVVRSALLSILQSEKNPPTSQNETEKEFIEASLNLLMKLQLYDRITFSTLIDMYLEGDKEIRNEVKSAFSNLGLKDNRGLFYQELDRWEVWSLDDNNRRQGILQMASEWLEKWITAFKLHIQDVIERLKQGDGVQGKVGGKKGKSNLKKDLSDPLAKSLTVTFDRPPDQSTVDNVTYLEAINYFVEMELAKLMEQKRSKKDEVIEEEEEGVKNTVLVLPSISKRTCLVRLGETHTSHCHPERETSLNVHYRRWNRTSRGDVPMPGDLHGFAPAIVLPMKSVDLNPWRSEPANEPIFVTLRLAPKYYIPEHSVMTRTN